MELTYDNVETVTKDCLYKAEEITDGQPPEDCVKVEGILHNMGFHPGRLESHREDVRSMLEQLPNEFRIDGPGGGWTFLNACNRKDGVQWGEHHQMEMLFCLGIGLGLAKWLLPRDTWAVLPGGMPYVSISV